MYKLRLILTEDHREELLQEIANKKLSQYKKSVWVPSATGKVWTHTSYGGKVEFLKETDETADYIKIWHPSEDDFEEARTVSSFLQWSLHRLHAYIQRIEIILN